MKYYRMDRNRSGNAVSALAAEWIEIDTLRVLQLTRLVSALAAEWIEI